MHARFLEDKKDLHFGILAVLARCARQLFVRLTCRAEVDGLEMERNGGEAENTGA